MLRYALAMKKGNIPWPLVEGLLTAMNKDRAWLEQQMELRKNVVTNWKSRGIPRTHAATLASILKTSADYLLQVPGASNEARQKPPAQAFEEVEDAPSLVATQKWLPVVGVVQAGPDGLLAIDDYPVGFGEGSVPYWSKCDNAYALRVRGESMSPRYLPGEFVAVDPCFEVQPSHECIVLLKDGTRMIKRLLWSRDGMASFESINKDYKNITLELSEIIGLHRVLGVVPSFAFKPSVS